VREVWDGRVSTIGSGSDFVAFQDFAGVPSVDLGFNHGPGGPTWHYHSNYDSWHWMDNFGDPGWHYHAAISRVWGLLTLELANSPVIPFSAVDYATALARYVDSLKDVAESSPQRPTSAARFTFKRLESALEKFRRAAAVLDDEAKALNQISSSGTSWPGTDGPVLRRLRSVNRRYKLLERFLLHPDGLDGRSWFKHTVFAPGLWTGYSGATFPGILESLESGDDGGVVRWEKIIAGQLDDLAVFLDGE